MQFRHPVGFWSLEAHDDNDILVQFVILEGFFDRRLIFKHARGRFYDATLRCYCGNFHDALSKIAAQFCQTACRLERVGRWAYDFFVQAFCWSRLPAERTIDQLWFCRVIGKAFSCNGFGVWMQETLFQQLSNYVSQTTCCVEMVHIGQTIWIDLSHKRCDCRDFREITWFKQNASSGVHSWQVNYQVGGASGCHQSHNAVYESLGIENVANRTVIVAQPSDFDCALGRCLGQSIAQRCIWIDK